MRGRWPISSSPSRPSCSSFNARGRGNGAGCARAGCRSPAPGGSGRCSAPCPCRRSSMAAGPTSSRPWSWSAFSSSRRRLSIGCCAIRGRGSGCAGSCRPSPPISASRCLYQYATGRNFYGFGRWADGELTGPFFKPRAGPELVRILFPAVLPPVMALISTRSWLYRGGRRPARRYRHRLHGADQPAHAGAAHGPRPRRLGAAAAAPAAGRDRRRRHRRRRDCGLTGDLAGRPITAWSRNSRRRWTISSSSPYGFCCAAPMRSPSRIRSPGAASTASAIGCPDAALLGGLDPRAGRYRRRPSDICKQHPHNFYTQASTDGGYPGLILFSLMVLAWLRDMGRGLWREPDPVRVGLFAAAFIHLWPIASTSAFPACP